MSDPALHIRGLHYSYGAHTVVDGISLSAHSGRVLGVLGPNGAGKSTTISLAVGSRRPDSGSVEVFGLDPYLDHARTAELAGVMLQDGGLPMSAKPLAVLKHLASLYPDPVPLDELVEPLGITEFSSRTIRRLSGGQKQRVALAAALIGRPRLVFLDEPVAGLDPAAREVVHDFVRGLRDSGVAVVLTTHDLVEAEELADELIVIDRGRIIAQGSPDQLTGSHSEGRALRITLADTSTRSAAAAAQDLVAPLRAIAPASALGDVLYIRGDVDASAIAAVCTSIAAAGARIADIRMQAASLSDVFFELTGRPLR